MTPFWWSWPSWLTELASGVLLVSITRGALALSIAANDVPHVALSGLNAAPLVAATFVLAMIGSALYELELDPNGWSSLDYCQRAVGIVAGLAAWVVLT